MQKVTRTMMKRITFVAFIALAAIAAAPVMAYRETRAGYGSGPGNFEDIAGAPGLNLSAEQVEKIGALRETHLKDIKPLQMQLFGKGRQLRALWLEQTPDKERILTLQREVQDLRGRLLDKLAAYRLEVHQILAPEQQAKVRVFDAERRMGRMGGHRPPLGWWEGERPPAADPKRGKRLDPQLKVDGEGIQQLERTGRSAGY